MIPIGPTWYRYFTIAIDDKKMSMAEAKEFCKEFNPDESGKAIEKLKTR